MSLPAVIAALDSVWCRLVFILALGIGYYLTPKDVLWGQFGWIAVPFIVLFGLTAACSVRGLKERAVSAKLSGASAMGVIAAVGGISALQLCGVGAPVCGATIGMGVISAVFPGFMLGLFREHSILILVLSIGSQLISLYVMHCFRLKKSASKS